MYERTVKGQVFFSPKVIKSSTAIYICVLLVNLSLNLNSKSKNDILIPIQKFHSDKRQTSYIQILDSNIKCNLIRKGDPIKLWLCLITSKCYRRVWFARKMQDIVFDWPFKWGKYHSLLHHVPHFVANQLHTRKQCNWFSSSLVPAKQAQTLNLHEKLFTLETKRFHCNEFSTKTTHP